MSALPVALQPINDYDSLQAAVLRWLARDGDPLISGDVPVMIQLFEAEARRRLFTLFGETGVAIPTVAGVQFYPLPAYFAEMRAIWIPPPPPDGAMSAGDGGAMSDGDDGAMSAGGGGVSSGVIQSLTYITPEEMMATRVGDQTRIPNSFTIMTGSIWFAPIPDAVYNVQVVYQAGLPALATAPLGVPGVMSAGDGGAMSAGDGGAMSSGPTTTSGTNWLVQQSPDAYLFGALCEAEARIGNDERIPMWQQRREASFASILLADRKMRWGGSALVMRTDTGNP